MATNKKSKNKLEFIEPSPFPPDVAKYLQPEVFPEIPGGSSISHAGSLINAKYGHFSLTISIWYIIGKLLCKQPSTPTRKKTSDGFSDGETHDSVEPSLVLDGFDPILISYAATGEKWYLQITLATLNNLWCNADWKYDVQFRTEVSKTPLSPSNNPANAVTRLDILTDYKVWIKIPDFWGYFRFKILNEKKESFEQTSGCIKYRFTNFEFYALITTKLIDKRFRTQKHKYRAPDIDISYKFEDVNYNILWNPFSGTYFPEDDDINIPNLTADKVKNIIDDVFDEKIKQNREEFINRYIRSTLIKVIPHMVEECRSKVDYVLTFATVLANGTDDDLYTLPKTTSKLLKLGAFSITQLHLRKKILNMIAPTLQLPDFINEIIEEKRKHIEKELAKIPKHKGHF